MPAYPSWPITREQLLPYYSRAAEWLQIKGGKRAELSEILIPTSQDLAAKPFGFSPPARYTSHYREHALKSKKIILITGATVHSLAANAGRVTSINVGDKQKKISLKCSGPVVLAGGAIGNSRILARSKASLDLPAKIHKYVGNFFFEHPHCYSLGHVLFKPEIAETISKPEFMSGSFISITPTSSYLTHNNLLDFNFQLSKDDQSSLKARNMPIIRNYKALYGIEPQLYRATLGMEQLPLESNSVINKSTVNGLNDGHLTLDLTTQKPLVAAAKKWLYLQGVHAWIESQPESQIQAVGHLHGTTRMSQNSDSGVVDANCRVYGLNNLFVAGSSVFPTAGFSNPTFTITALAIRLADHIATT
ncbi:Oxygen-dependent choline dehydrogenase [compost metagenome]